MVARRSGLLLLVLALLAALSGGAADARRQAPSTSVGVSKRTTLQLRLSPGSYRLICDLADHEARGMRTTFRVTQ